ncbi:hypothetical protein PMAYCL1PPCAC_19088, partial [Pristionchus mayeri]
VEGGEAIGGYKRGEAKNTVIGEHVEEEIDMQIGGTGEYYLDEIPGVFWRYENCLNYGIERSEDDQSDDHGIERA